MFPTTVDLAWRTFQTRRDPRALAVVFDRTAKDLLALGRHLASPGTDAEDLVQATFVTAIEDAGSHRQGAPVLPWLVGILSNHARAARRRSRRTIDATRLPDTGTDAAADAAANEVNAELRAAIDRLPEVYRPVLRLLFEHGLEAQEIARTLERPAGTVRAQVSRGIEMLRRLLPASLAGAAAVTVATGRGLAAVRQHVLASCGGAGVAAPSLLFLGGLVVLQHKLAAAVAAVIALALGFWWFDLRPAGALPGPAPVAESPTVVQAPLPAAPVATERDAVAAAETGRDNAAPAAADADPERTGTLVVRVKAPDGAALAGIGVAVAPSTEMQNLGKNLAHVLTDATGEVRFAGLVAGQWMIDIDRLGTAGLAYVEAGETESRDIALPAGIRVDGRVVDRRGAPAAGAFVVLHGSRSGTVHVATADNTGTFTIPHLATDVRLQARASGREPSLAHTVRAADGSTVTVELVLGDAARTVRGRVLDSRGQPVADAAIAMLPVSECAAVPAADRPHVLASWTRTAADGTFACDEIGAGRQLVLAQPAGPRHAPAWAEVDTTNGDAVAAVRLPDGATVAGTIRRDDAPAPNLQVVAWPIEQPRIGYLLNLFGFRYATTAADGSFRLAGLIPGKQSLRLLDGMATLREEQPTLREGETLTWDQVLGAGQGLSIAVRSEHNLAAHRLVALVTRSVIRDGDMPAIVSLQPDGTCTHNAPRDANVDVVICSMPGGPNMLQLAAVRSVPPEQSDVRFTLAAGDLPQRFLLGRLVDAQRAPLGGATIAATKIDPNGLFARLETVTAADGSFRLGPLPAGDYVLLEGAMQSPRHAGRATLTADRDEDVGDLAVAR